MRPVSIAGTGQIPVQKNTPMKLRQMAAKATRLAMQDAGIAQADLLVASNMLADELQGQKNLGALFSDEAGLSGIETMEVRAATASGAAALRAGYLAVASGAVNTAIIVGAEKMSAGISTPALAKALDAEKEVPDGSTLLSQNAELMRLYMKKYKVPPNAFANFSVNSHGNALHNPRALFNQKPITEEDVLASRMISYPLRLLDCSPVCDGAAAIILVPQNQTLHYTDHPVHILASASATDRFRLSDRVDPLILNSATISAQKAFEQAGMQLKDIDFYEIHDAFSITACLLLEAVGFASPGQGWKLAVENEIALQGTIPLSTMGGLKARGHPIGATALYQVCEIVQQLTHRAGDNQLSAAEVALSQSVGGVAATTITHIFGI